MWFCQLLIIPHQLTIQYVRKGGLISECFSLWHKSPQNKVPNHDSKHLLFRWIVAQDRDLAPFLGDLSQDEKLSEVNPPVYKHATSEIISSYYMLL